MDRIANARRLRQEHTDAERKLWSIVRNRKLDGFKFRRQVPIDRYFADFACLEARLIVELDGGQHAEQVEYDEARTTVLQACGFRFCGSGTRRCFCSPTGSPSRSFTR